MENGQPCLLIKKPLRAAGGYGIQRKKISGTNGCVVEQGNEANSWWTEI